MILCEISSTYLILHQVQVDNFSKFLFLCLTDCWYSTHVWNFFYFLFYDKDEPLWNPAKRFIFICNFSIFLVRIEGNYCALVYYLYLKHQLYFLVPLYIFLCALLFELYYVHNIFITNFNNKLLLILIWVQY